MNNFIKNIMAKKETVANPIQDFIEKIQNGEIILPDGLEAVDENTSITWPTSIIYQQKVIPINYDKDTNTITLQE